MNSPHLDEAKDTRFTRRRGRNRKVPSALPLLLSSGSLLSGVAVTSRDHLWIRRDETKKMGLVRRREVPGEERWVWWCRGRGERESSGENEEERR